MRIYALISFVAANIIATLSTQAIGRKDLTTDEKKQYEEAMTYASKTNNRAAVAILKELYDKHQDNIDIAYNLGLCYINMSGNPDSALYYLQKVYQVDKDSRWNESKGDLMLALARAYQMCGKPEEALPYYDEIEKHDKKKEFEDVVKFEREVCANALTLKSIPVKLSLCSVGESVNSAWNDYRPILSVNEDTMYFTSRRPKKDADKKVRFDDGQYEEGVYRAVRMGNKWGCNEWGNVEQIQNLIVDGKKAGQETVTSISGDGTEMYLCHDGDIYVSKLVDGKWQPAERLSEPINTALDEQNAFISADGQQLFFSSNAPGGYGGRDIYRSRRLPNGKWGEPLNLGPAINSADDEDSPVYHTYSNVLYFSSNGRNTMGGYDIFYSPEGEGGVFEGAKNIGFPINSPDDDMYFYPSMDKDRAFYASIRWNNGHTASYDIYEVEYEQPAQNTMALLSAPVEAEDITKVIIFTYDKEDGENVGMCRPNTRTHRFLEIVEAGKDYDILAVYKNDTIRTTVSTKKSDCYFNTHSPLDLDPLAFAEKIANDQVEASNRLVASNEGHLGFGNGAGNTETDEVAENEIGSISKPGEVVPKVSDEEEKKDEDDEETESEWKQWITDDSHPYTVQIMSLRKTLSKKLLKKLDADKVAEYRYHDGWFVYSYGAFSTYQEAREAQDEIRKTTPYKDAFSRRGQQYKKFVNRTLRDVLR